MTREEYLQLEFAYDRVLNYYNRMLNVSTTTGRKNNFERICIEIQKYPALEEYWKIFHEGYRYAEKVRCLKQWETSPFKTTFENQVAELPHSTTEACCSYIVVLEKEKCIKVGKTNNFNSRMKSLANQYGTVRPLHVFDFDNEEDAYIMEVVLHKYFKERYPDSFIPQDRFKDADFTLADLIALEKSAQKIREIKWF